MDEEGGHRVPECDGFVRRPPFPGRTFAYDATLLRSCDRAAASHSSSCFMSSVDDACDGGSAAIEISMAMAVMSIGVTAELGSTLGISHVLRMRTRGSDKLFQHEVGISLGYLPSLLHTSSKSLTKLLIQQIINLDLHI